MPVNYKAGNQGTTVLNAIQMALIAWTVTPTAKTVDFETSLSGGFDLSASTFLSATFSVTIEYDFTTDMLALGGPPAVGATITNSKLYLAGSSGNGCWAFPSAIVVSTPQSLAVGGKIQTTINCKSNGPFTQPSLS